MGAIIGRYKMYSSGGRTVFVATHNNCPRINLMNNGSEVRFRDDFSKGFRTGKNIAKALFR